MFQPNKVDFILCLYSLDMLDKQEAPSVVDGYGLSVAFLCMLDVVKCVTALIENPAHRVRQQTDDSSGNLSDSFYACQYGG